MNLLASELTIPAEIGPTLAVALPVFSVFLGMLFGFRYHAFYEGMDAMLLEAGEEGFSAEEKTLLERARFAIFFGIGVFVATLTFWMLVGIPITSESQYAFWLACAGHFFMSLTLLVAALRDRKYGIARPWLRSLVLLLGAAGTLAVPLAAFTLEPTLLMR